MPTAIQFMLLYTNKNILMTLHAVLYWHKWSLLDWCSNICACSYVLLTKIKVPVWIRKLRCESETGVKMRLKPSLLCPHQLALQILCTLHQILSFSYSTNSSLQCQTTEILIDSNWISPLTRCTNNSACWSVLTLIKLVLMAMLSAILYYHK